MVTEAEAVEPEVTDAKTEEVTSTEVEAKVEPEVTEATEVEAKVEPEVTEAKTEEVTSKEVEEKVTQEVTEPIEATPKTEEPEVTTTVTEEKVIFEDKVNLGEGGIPVRAV